MIVDKWTGQIVSGVDTRRSRESGFLTWTARVHCSRRDSHALSPGYCFFSSQVFGVSVQCPNGVRNDDHETLLDTKPVVAPKAHGDAGY
jgi:hypothetical protein